jgi:hypothetical protein
VLTDQEEKPVSYGLADLYKHSFWANTSLLDVCARLDDAPLVTTAIDGWQYGEEELGAT